MINIQPNSLENSLITVSGGADSMCLLHLCKDIPGIMVAHVNYNFRDDSGEDEELVKQFCLINNIKLHTKVIQKETIPLSNFEEWARIIRYEFFESIQHANKLASIVTAHNANDQAETVIMRMIRGTGLKGLQGIHETRQQFIRPLLGYTKADIYTYCKVHNVPYREDSTNTDVKYFRNKIRHSVLQDEWIKPLCNISSIAQRLYPKLLLKCNELYASSIIRTPTELTIDKSCKFDDLLFIYLSEWLSVHGITLTNNLYETIKSNNPSSNCVILSKKCVCNKRKKKSITISII